MKTWLNSEAHCITITQLCLHSLETVRGTSNQFPDYYTIHLIKYDFMLLFYKQIDPSLNADCATSISSSRSTRKGGIPCMCSTVPPRSPILPSSSNIHCLSLSLRDHYCQFYDWTHSDGCMVLLFQSIFIVSLHYSSSHHHTVKRKWPETPLFLKNH